MSSRSWRWLRVRILGLLDSPGEHMTLADGSTLAIPGSRLGRRFQQS